MRYFREEANKALLLKRMACMAHAWHLNEDVEATLIQEDHLTSPPIAHLQGEKEEMQQQVRHVDILLCDVTWKSKDDPSMHDTTEPKCTYKRSDCRSIWN